MAGYSGTPLIRKLGFRPGQRALLCGVPEELSEITGFADFAVRHTHRDGAALYDLVMIFETERERLEAWAAKLPELLSPQGMVWIAWPKKASRRPTTLSEDVLRQVLLPLGLVDVKVCAIDIVWSGLKFVVRQELRARWPAGANPGEH